MIVVPRARMMGLLRRLIIGIEGMLRRGTRSGWHFGRLGFVEVMSLFYVSFYALIHRVATYAQWLEHVKLTLLDCIMP